MARTMRRLTLAMLCTVAGGLLLCGAPAQAASTRELSGSFGPDGSGSGVFGNPQGIAVEQTTGDVYVYDQSDGGNIYKFNAAGMPVDFASSSTNVIKGVGGRSKESEIAIDSSSGPDKGDIYIATGKEVLIYRSTGAKLATLVNEEEEGEEGPCGVAVDPSGAVYIAFLENQAIKKYIPGSSNPVTKEDYTSSLSKVGELCNIAADSAGDIYAEAEEGHGAVIKYDASQFSTSGAKAIGTVLENEGEEAKGVTLAVDSANGNVYIDEESDVTEYDASGELIGRFGEAGAGALSESYGVAVSDSSGEVYVAQGDGKVEIFPVPVVAPEVITGEATGVTRTTSTLNGSVNPEGLPVASCEFEYGTTSSYGQSIACEQKPIEGNEQVPVSAKLAGLSPGTEYDYRLVVSTENGNIYYGSRDALQTAPAVEGVRIAAASDVLATSATLNGSLEPNSFDTHYFFEYGEGSGSSYTPTAREDAGELSEVEQVSTSVTGLEPNKAYFFRLVAENSFGTTKASNEENLKTIAVKPVIHVLPAGVTSTTAGLADTLNPENSPTAYRFVYGMTEEYGQSTPEITLPSSFGEETVDGGVISELKPGTTLHYRLIAANEVGTSEGPDQTITTSSAAAPPTAITTGASNVSQNTATISGTVSTNGLQTSYGFEIGTEAGNYGPATGLGSLGGVTTETVTMTLGELQPGTTYHYRVTTTSLDGTSYGTDQTFTTAGFPTLLTAPAAPPLIATPTIAFPTEVVTTGTTTKALTRAQKLAKALKACKKEKKKAKRAGCKREAQDKYAPAKAKKKSKKQKK